ncbi:MAG: type II secretion system protein [Phycisphaerales bacterium]|nr:MAG: type II secretion system protein [Phycisphaerales bacterium]
MSGKNEKSKGFILTEIIVALTILGMVLAGLAVSLAGFARFNRYQLIRQRCIAAAEAQLDSIATTSRPVSEEDLRRLWPGLTVSVRQSPGEGQWQGLEFVEVTASGKSYRKDVNIRLSRYVRSDGSLAEGK